MTSSQGKKYITLRHHVSNDINEQFISGMSLEEAKMVFAGDKGSLLAIAGWDVSSSFGKPIVAQLKQSNDEFIKEGEYNYKELSYHYFVHLLGYNSH